MRLSSPGNVGVVALLFGLGLASTAHAQQQITQTVTWTPSQQTGWTGGLTYLCYQNDRYLGYNPGNTMTFTWTDTTTAPIGAVRIDVSINSHYNYAGLVFQFAVNGVVQSNSLTTTSQNTTCSSNQAFTIQFETGITAWTPGGSNTITMNHQSGNGYFGFNPNASYQVQFLITQLNLEPFPPSNLTQIDGEGSGIPVGGTCIGSSLTLRALVTDPDSDPCYIEAEFQPPLVFFTGTPTHVGIPTNSGNLATIDMVNVPEGPYHWQVRTVDPLGFKSPWVSFGNNSEIVADVVVDHDIPPPAVADVVNHGAGDCNISAAAAPGTLIPGILAAALMAFGLARRRR